jgi:tryptophanyl-tRNA synthetase
VTKSQAAGRPRARILSGIRPTGPLHVGHIVGALANWVRLQAEHECFFMFADWHALTTAYPDPSGLRECILENAACALAAGVDPKRAVLFRQSDVPEHAELHLLLSMVTPVPWLERVPSYKEQREQITDRDLATYGFLGYPVLQAADILAYKSSLVPVGDDQVPHLEVAREIARRFNHLYGAVFPEPQPLLTSTPRLPGPYRRKMSKSYGNAIEIGAGEASLEKMVKAMFTDPKKIHLGDKGHPEECVVFAFHQSFSENAAAEIEKGCRDGSRGCVACKKSLLEPMWEKVGPVHEARRDFLADPSRLEAILCEGADRARKIAAGTMREVRSAMKLA